MLLTLLALFKIFLSSSFALSFAFLLAVQRIVQDFGAEPFEPPFEVIPAEEEVIPLIEE